MDELEKVRFPDSGGFPPSYVAYVQRVGWARLFGLWLLYPPVRPGYADGLSGRGGNLTERFRVGCRDAQENGYDWVIEPDGDWDLAERLEVFGWSENGDALLWDTSARDSAGEFPIWESPRMQALHRRGTDLGEVLAGLRERSVGLTHPSFDAEPLPAVRL